MTDLEMTRLCAEAMGYGTSRLEHDSGENPCVVDGKLICWHAPNPEDEWEHRHFAYDPLHDDAQAMALVKKFDLFINNDVSVPKKWIVFSGDDFEAISENLNRAIVECVAKMQAAKK